MSRDKYPFYYEVCVEERDEGLIEEGGFIIAGDYCDAMAQISAVYEPGLSNVKLECLHASALVFPIEAARAAKKWVEENYAY